MRVSGYASEPRTQTSEKQIVCFDSPHNECTLTFLQARGSSFGPWGLSGWNLVPSGLTVVLRGDLLCGALYSFMPSNVMGFPTFPNKYGCSRNQTDIDNRASRLPRQASPCAKCFLSKKNLGTQFHGKIFIFPYFHVIIRVRALGVIFIRMIQASEPFHNLLKKIFFREFLTDQFIIDAEFIFAIDHSDTKPIPIPDPSHIQTNPCSESILACIFTLPEKYTPYNF